MNRANAAPGSSVVAITQLRKQDRHLGQAHVSKEYFGQTRAHCSTKKPVDMTKIVVKIIRLRLANGRQCNLELLATRFSQSLQLLLAREISYKGMTESFKARIILEPMPRSDTGIPKFWMYLKPGHCTAKVNCLLEADYRS